MNNNKIPIFLIIFQSFRSIKKIFIRINIQLILMSFVFIVLNIIFFHSEIYNNIYYLIPYSLLLLINSSIIAVHIHRLNLVKNHYSLSIFCIINFKIYSKYIIFSIVIILIDILISTIIISYFHFTILIFKDIYYIDKIIKPISFFLKNNNILIDMFKYFLQVPAHYVFSRLILALPLIAIDQSISLKNLWKISRKNGLKLLIFVHFLPWLYFYFISNCKIKHDSITNIIIFSCINLIAMYIMVTITSISYRYVAK